MDALTPNEPERGLAVGFGRGVIAKPVTDRRSFRARKSGAKVARTPNASRGAAVLGSRASVWSARVFSTALAPGFMGKERRPGYRGLSVATAAILFALALTGCRTAEPTSASSLRDDWIDSQTGHRVVRLSRLPGESESFYFHQNAYAPAGDKMVFENSQPGASNCLFTLELATRHIERKSRTYSTTAN